ncbi:hypothetical protein [Rossellomorea vietnamensis]|nr:hypothetical protein [Rossellomorea vietnamensis]
MKKMNFRNLKIGKKYGLTLTFVFLLFGMRLSLSQAYCIKWEMM